ncbi:MAG: shikimate kinase [Ruminococcus sp.]|nr:shikimate kinase [Ruminococcus sp.]
MNKRNIILIGMPGVGKSTIGVILAKILGYRFIDTDLIIQEKEGRLLKDIIAKEGIDGFLEIENRICSELETEKCVIATGGSAVYGASAMEHFKEIGTVVYLQLDYRKLKYRLGNIRNRGVVIRKGQRLWDLYKERTELYEKYADLVIDENGCGIEKTVNKILAKLQ